MKSSLVIEIIWGIDVYPAAIIFFTFPSASPATSSFLKNVVIRFSRTIGSVSLSTNTIFVCVLSHTYFWVGNKAGIGTPSSKGGGWQWKRDDTQLKEIKKAMSVFDKTTQPELIKLSLKVN